MVTRPWLALYGFRCRVTNLKKLDSTLKNCLFLFFSVTNKLLLLSTVAVYYIDKLTTPL